MKTGSLGEYVGPRGRFQNEGLRSLHRSSNIFRVIKPNILRWAGHVARMYQGRSAFKMLTSKPTGRRPLEGLGVDGRTILE